MRDRHQMKPTDNALHCLDCFARIENPRAAACRYNF
jgi:hypothetical protein